MPAEYWPEGSVLLGKSFAEVLAEVFQLEVTVSGEACRETLTAVKEALVKDSHAGQVCEVSTTWEDFLCEVMEDRVTSLVQEAAFVKVAQMSYDRVAEEEEDSLKVLGDYLVVVFVGVLFSGEHHSQLLTHYLLPPTGNLVL